MKPSAILIPIITSGLLVAAYWVLLWITFGGVSEGWTSLGTPPEKAVKLVGADPDTVYAQASNGHIYGCTLFSSAEKCWQETDHMEITPDPYPCTFSPSDILKPPGEIIDRIDVYYCGADMSSETNYALLADGSVWNRRYGRAGNFLGCLLIQGSQAVFVIGLLLGIFLRKRHRPVGAA
jgi:hypothetical protein